MRKYEYMQEILKTTMKLIKRYSTFAQMDEKFSWNV